MTVYCFDLCRKYILYLYLYIYHTPLTTGNCIIKYLTPGRMRPHCVQPNSRMAHIIMILCLLAAATLVRIGGGSSSGGAG